MKKSANIELMYTELPWADRFRAAKRDGFEFVEFWDWDNKDLNEVKSLTIETGISVATISGDKQYDLCNPADKEQYIAQVKESIKAAQKINCPNLVVHSNELGPDGFAKNVLADLSDTVKIISMFDNLKVLAPYAEEAGVTLVLEALNTVTDHIGNFLTSTQCSAEITKLVSSPNIKILYDVYHMYLNEGKLTETLSKYIDQIGFIHVADAPGRHEPGTGVINYRNLFSFLKEIGYDGVVGFELYPKNGTEDAVKAIMNLT